METNSPLFMNRLWTGAELAGVVAEWMVSCINTSAGAWDISPVFSVMEREVIRQFLHTVGFDNGCGVFTPGGSTGNLYAAHVARERALSQGHKLIDLAVICSTEAHYSIVKAMRMIGVPELNVFRVSTDLQGSIDVAELASTLKEIQSSGKFPFLVHLTSGTTVLGAFDDLEGSIEAARPFGSWVHVDASWGGAVLLSKTHSPLMKGVQKADSVAWCAHKMFGAPLHASIILYQNRDALRSGFDCDTPYIYQANRYVPSETHEFDMLGKYTFQCSRPADSVKVRYFCPSCCLMLTLRFLLPLCRCGSLGEISAPSDWNTKLIMLLKWQENLPVCWQAMSSRTFVLCFLILSLPMSVSTFFQIL